MQAITFLSDGGDTVRDLQLYLSPLAEHLLDWFHITMRITVLRQQIMARHYVGPWRWGRRKLMQSYINARSQVSPTRSGP